MQPISKLTVVAGVWMALTMAHPIEATTIVNPGGGQSLLGRGVNSETGELAENCIVGTVEPVNNTKITINYKSSQSVYQLLNESQGKVSGEVDLWLASGSATAEFHSRMSENELTSSHVFKINYTGPDLRLEQRSLSELGESTLAGTVASRTQTCGDEFIQHLQLGSHVYLTAQMIFSSTDEYDHYSEKMEGRILFFSDESEVSETFQSLTENGIYTIAAYSEVDLPAPITDVLGGSGNMHCRTNNMKQCIDSFNQVLSYLLDAQQYGVWLSSVEQLPVIYARTSGYQQSGHFDMDVQTPNDNKDTLPLLRYLLDGLIDNLEKRNVIEAFKNVTGDEQLFYHGQLLKADSNIELLEGAIESCRIEATVEVCQSAIDALTGNLQRLETAVN
ncbi:MAG: hypothetical protein HRT35_00920 [Algicola sp.]|nr:hypothetical protein [Algicola sp.]